LRRVLVEVVGELGSLDVEQMDAVAELIEAAIEEAVGSYVRARDYETRRVEGEHIGFIAHELRSPLTAAQVTIAQLSAGGVLPGDKRIALLDRSLRRMAELIEKTLQSQRLEAHAMDVNRETLLFGQILEGPIENAAARAQAKGIELCANYDPKTVLTADRQLTTSAAQNLLDNAVKFTERGRVNLWVEERSNELAVHVTDTGPGISQEERAIIFEPFRRGARHGQTPGAGLGLAITKGAIEAQGGAIHCESEPGEGSHFWFTLPR
jgi:signal transduction histidine kinase